MLIDSPLPEMQIGLSVIIPVVLGLAGILLVLVSLGVNAQRQPSVTGESGMLNTLAEALTSIEPEGVGRVRTHGEIWTATANERIDAGDHVIITAVNGLLLSVRKV
jgi:membrane-bound serine protease (ClpP class)